MAMQAASHSEAAPSAQVVGNAFVEQYYNILHQSPELVHKFYQDSSVLSRPDFDGIMTSVTTMQAINDKIQSLDYKNYKAEIKTADAQDSYQDGVIVLVTGYLTGKDNVRRNFTQTFFLAPQEKGYFVLNDVFRYVEETDLLEMSSTAVNGIYDSAPTVPSTSDPEPAHVPDHPACDLATIEVEDPHNDAEVFDPSDIEEGSVIEEEVVNEPPTHFSQNETIAAISSDPSAAQEEKKSYASIVKVTKVSKPSTAVYVPTSSVRGLPGHADQPRRGSAKPYPEPEASAPTSDSTPESSIAQEEVEGHSIYVQNLPSNATPTELAEEFKKFGSIKHDGIQVRSNMQGFCFGFVEFESLDSMLNAIKASPVTIGGRQALVEEKKTTTRVGSSGRGRYHSGRGGYRSDSFRGRSNFGGGRGYGRNEFRNQGEFSSWPKGSGGRNAEIYQRVDQNGSGRFGRQDGVNKTVAST